MFEKRLLTRLDFIAQFTKYFNGLDLQVINILAIQNSEKYFAPGLKNYVRGLALKALQEKLQVDELSLKEVFEIYRSCDSKDLNQVSEDLLANQTFLKLKALIDSNFETNELAKCIANSIEES